MFYNITHAIIIFKKDRIFILFYFIFYGGRLLKYKLFVVEDYANGLMCCEKMTYCFL